jgi:hypothetical protein
MRAPFSICTTPLLAAVCEAVAVPWAMMPAHIY